MANVCVDPKDFQTDAGGKLQLNPEFLQTPTLTFTRLLTGTANTYAIVPDIAPLVVVVPGIYVVTWDAHGNATNIPNTPGTSVNTSVSSALGLNGTMVGGTETMLMQNVLGGSPSIAIPAVQLHSSGTGHRVLTLAANDQISMFAARASDPGTTTDIRSDQQGRCRITMWRIGTV